MSFDPEYQLINSNVKAVLWRLGIIALALILGGIGSGLSHSAGPMIAAGFFSVIMLAFAFFAGTGNHRAAQGLAAGLGAVIVISETHRAIKRHEQSRQ